MSSGRDLIPGKGELRTARKMKLRGRGDWLIWGKFGGQLALGRRFGILINVGRSFLVLCIDEKTLVSTG